VLAPPGRHVGHRPLEDLEQRLLNALALTSRVIEGLSAARNLVDLVDVDDPPLRAGDVEVGRLDEPEKDVLDILADVARLGEAGRIGNAEWDVNDLGERLGQQGLATAVGPTRTLDFWSSMSLLALLFAMRRKWL